MVVETTVIVLKLVVALLLGALVGLEREWKRKPAGLRTHMLVSMGACMFTVVSMTSFNTDPARVASGIVTGIGFIGAGSIIGSRGHIHGITTAATLWIVAAIGLAVGAEMYVLAFAASILVFIVLQLRRLEVYIEEEVQRL
jgi:putative Mg2+ transporter-C (MgtC) family protein